MPPIQNRLIDNNIIYKMLEKNPLMNNHFHSRLIDYKIQPPESFHSKLLKIEKKIDKIQTAAVNDLIPNLINGILFIIIVLFIYFILHYRYQKKKESYS